ncbi:Pal1-domain-containing protein [Choiromyces venosus 120613-1]|uniref:Pal1-domain-containing protein n=1 Tax=Choiromyces venosus 120613-1 TaxID=1336337 RepID=A0A3N4JCK8_9PEZI|nr:Pal1-domain-containing protein [Choiromyces venosus 120613-1]
MSLVQPPVPGALSSLKSCFFVPHHYWRRPSPSIELGTNNPFRRRLSNTPSSPASATNERFSFASTGGRPQSRNPFLDVFEGDFYSTERPSSAHKANSFDSSSALRPQFSGATAELFENLTITDHSGDTNANNMYGRSNDRDNMPPPPYRPQQRQRDLPNGHHHSRSSDEKGVQLIPIDSTPRNPPPRQRPSPNGRPVADRPRDMDREPRRRPRRNSDSSVMEAHEAEQKDRERRERRHRDQRSRDQGSGSGSGRKDKDDRARRERDRKKNGAPLDVIDKLDVTGIYGSGLFHHDGPFDACNPHRNAKNSRRLAPVHAFPADSANNALSGFGPVNAKADHSHLFGNRDPEAFNDFTASGRRPSAPSELASTKAIGAFDPKKNADIIHGDETLGLGTSTFLDGTPASRAAVQKSGSTDDRPKSPNGMNSGGGLQRKKSLAQKVRSIGQSRTMDGPIQSHRRPPPPPNRSPTDGPYSPTTPGGSSSHSTNNPFFSDYDGAYDKKGETISVSERRAPGSPRKPSLGRVQTGDGKPGENGGLMKRVRSLSKPKRRND